MKILVTGGAGYVGSVLVRQLLARGHRVHVLDNLMFGGNTLLPLFINPNFSFAKVDICDRAAVEAEMDGVDAVVHLAALVGYPLCKKMPNRAVEVNVEGTKNVIAAMPSDARLVYASTAVTTRSRGCAPRTRRSTAEPLRTGQDGGGGTCLAVAPIALRFATVYGLSPRPVGSDDQ